MENTYVEGLVFQDIWKSFSNKPVLKGISLKVKYGEIVSLLGPNGSGKSTLFKIALGILSPDRGHETVGSINPLINPLKARKIIGYMPEELTLFESLKVEEFVEFLLSIYEVKVSRYQIYETLKVLGLEKELGKLVGELSHGNKRRVFLASLMLRDPYILILDEAFTGLDPVGARLLKIWVRNKAARGTAVLFSTHVLPIAEAVADRIIIIHKGEIKAEGKPEELRKLFGVKELEDVFLEVTGYYPQQYEEIIRNLYG